MIRSDVYKNISLTGELSCGGEFDVNLGFTLEADLKNSSTDIVMSLGHSYTMNNSSNGFVAMSKLKEGATAFVNRIYNNTQGTSNLIRGGTRLQIYEYSTYCGTLVRSEERR